MNENIINNRSDYLLFGADRTSSSALGFASAKFLHFIE